MTPEIQKSQMRCGKCNHLFSGDIIVNCPIDVYLASLKAQRCPSCGAGYKKLLMGQSRSLAEDTAFDIGVSLSERIARWPQNGEIGQSSQAIHAFMTGTRSLKHFPRDAADFRRCVLLLHRIPEWRPRMGEMAALGNEWSRLALAWPALEAAFLDDVGPGLDRVPAPKLHALLEPLIQEHRSP